MSRLDEEAQVLISKADPISDPCDHEAVGVKPYNETMALAMTLNYMIGTGCFGLPFAFMKAGLGLTSSLLVLGLLGALVTMNYTLESLARAEGVCGATKGGGPMHRLTYRKFDFAMVGDMFAGKTGKFIVQIVILCYCVGTLWSYASVFASSVSSLFFTYALHEKCDVYGLSPSLSCLNAYYICMAVFAVIAISMVLMDISEQASVQQFLSVYRIVALVLMLVTLTVKMCMDGFEVLTIRYDKIGLANWQNFGRGFGPTILALNCHYNMPDALQPLENKQAARKVAFTALVISAVFYLCLAVFGAVAFDEINPLASLMWSDYTGCGNGWAKCEKWNPFGIVVQLVILLFPVVNVTSTFPMVGVTMGDNMLMSMPKSLTAPLGGRMSRSFCRLFASIPPLLLAVAFKKLDFIFSVAGLFGFLLGLSIPCWFQVIGSRYCERVWGYSGASITPWTVPVLSSVSFASVFLVLTFIITGVAVASLRN